MSKLPVKYSNVIVRSAQRLNLVEQRIIFNAISKIPPNKKIEPTDTFYISAEEYANLSKEPDLKNAYRDLKTSAKSLLRRFVTLAEEDSAGKTIKEIEFNWLSAGHYLESEGLIGISFNPFMIPYINLLRERFTLFELREITGFRSSYTQPLYVRLMQYMREPKTSEMKQSWIEYIDIEDLKIMLDATKYARYPDFKRKVLDIACRQINESEYTKFTVKFEPHKKEKKRVISLKFSMRLKKQAQIVNQSTDIPSVAEQNPDTDTVDMFSGLTTRQATLTERQVVMLADWLTGQNPRPLAEHGLDS